MADRDASDPARELTLRERLPEYAAVFAAGLGGAAAVGLLVGSVSSVAVVSAIGYTIVLLGIVFLLAGGAAGGGYANLGVGAVGAMFGGRRADEDEEEHRARHERTGRGDPMDRLRRGLQPEANPRAFWQVVGGVLYVAIGLTVVIIAS